MFNDLRTTVILPFHINSIAPLTTTEKNERDWCTAQTRIGKRYSFFKVLIIWKLIEQFQIKIL